MHIHILGICGTFMGGLAALAREAGHKVTGCDAGVYPPMSDQLRALGIELIEGFGTQQLNLQPDMFVVGNVVSRAHLTDGTPKFPLMEAILDAGLPYTRLCRPCSSRLSLRPVGQLGWFVRTARSVT